jgi:hypothetical protein
MACPGDARALMTWGERLMTFPDAGGLVQSCLHNLLEPELLNRADVTSSTSTNRRASPPAGRNGSGVALR